MGAPSVCDARLESAAAAVRDVDSNRVASQNVTGDQTQFDANRCLTGVQRLNVVITSRSKRAEFVVMSMPDISGTGVAAARSFMSYCESLTAGLDRVMFVHSSGHEIVDLQQ